MYQPPFPQNEPIYGYAPGSPERARLEAELERQMKQVAEIPMIINGQLVYTKRQKPYHPPFDHQKTIAHYYEVGEEEVTAAIGACLDAKPAWEAMPWEHRISIFRKAAELISGPYRDKMNAATMIGQGKNVHQSEIEAIMEMCDFLRFNAYYAWQIFSDQPLHSPKPTWNRTDWRPLEGFLYAITPFNFSAIAANLPSAPAMVGNCVVWKPSPSQIPAASVIMEVFQEAGLPEGVINLVFGDPDLITDRCVAHKMFAGLHYTGSTGVLKSIWRKIADHIDTYHSYPRIVGESGGKDFIVAHRSARPRQVATAITRGAFEYQGQKCSAASRVYLPDNIAEEVLQRLKEDLDSIKVGSPLDFSNFVNSVIHERAFDKLAAYIDQARSDSEAQIFYGGQYDKSTGYYIYPTVITTTDPYYATMVEELFGPVVTVYTYPADEYERYLDIVDSTSQYGLTGAVFAQDRSALVLAEEKLRHAAGNFYLNDKPTGSIVGQQPFGGARGSGTNDKAGSWLNITRWLSARSIKENFVPPEDYRYPFLGDD
jgi:1-pyrroline-5-carboxylate dehydrogenase